MIHRHAHEGTVWIDCEAPTEDEKDNIAREFNLDLRLQKELSQRGRRQHTALYGETLHLTLHIPALKHSHTEFRRQEIDIILGKNFIITLHSDFIDPIHKFSKSFETEKTTHPEELTASTLGLFFGIMQKLYRSVTHELEYQNDVIHAIEEILFEGEDKEIVRRLSTESLNLLVIEHTIEEQGSVLEDFAEVLAVIFDGESKKCARGISVERSRVKRSMYALRDRVDELRTINDSLLAIRQNEITNKLTIVATTILPATLITGVFGMNFHDIPLTYTTHGFWLLIVLMGLMVLSIILLFKLKRWF